MLVTTLANCASNVSGSAPCASKPGMPDMKSRSPVRAANDSGGALMPDGGGKCLMAIVHLWSVARNHAASSCHGCRLQWPDAAPDGDGSTNTSQSPSTGGCLPHAISCVGLP